MAVTKPTYQTHIGVPFIGSIPLLLEYDMGWKRTVIERVASIIALGGIMLMVAFLTMEGHSPPWVTATLGVSAMVSVLLIYGIPISYISFGRFEIKFEERD